MAFAPMVSVSLSFVAGTVIGTIAHEIGHWLCAIAVSMPVRLVSIGRGRTLRRARIGETQFEWRLVPIGGVTACYPLLILSRWRYGIFLIGGVLANIALAAIILFRDRLDLEMSWFPDSAIFTMYLVQLHFLRNLVPFIERRRKVASDGLLLWRLARGERSGVTEAGWIYAAMLARYSGRADQRPDMSRASSRLVYHLGQLGSSDDSEIRREAYAALERELARGVLAREEELLALDRLMSDALIREECDLGSDLERWSSRAFSLAPDLASIRDSRGACLVRLGRHLEAKALLAPVADQEMSMFDRLMTHAFLARAEFGLGDIAAARHWAISARELNADLGDPPNLRAMLARLEARWECRRPPLEIAGQLGALRLWELRLCLAAMNDASPLRRALVVRRAHDKRIARHIDNLRPPGARRAQRPLGHACALDPRSGLAGAGSLFHL